MAFNQLKKWVGTQLWSTFMTDYNQNIDELNRVIDGVNGIGETGVVTFTNVVSGETASQVISYKNTYSQAPRVVVVNSTTFPHAMFASVSNLTTTGFTLNARHAIGDTRTLYVVWIAMAQ